MTLRTLEASVAKIERPADDVMILHLQLPANEHLPFLAGQYLDVLLDDSKRRSFSIANAPRNDGFLQLHIRHLAGGTFTDAVFGKLKEQDRLRVEAPRGKFHLRAESSKPIIFVASGTGFAPVKAIIEHAFDSGMGRPMTLYWGGRRPKDLYLSGLARGWAAEHVDFRYVPVISDALPEDAWTGRAGLVHRAVVEDFPDLSQYQVYACGVREMVEAARRDFTGACRLPEDEFYSQ